MELQQIKYFLAVVDSGTFLAASKQVHVSQPTLSAGIRKLEQTLDVTLFHRGSRAATLTQAGKQFLTPARQSYNQLNAIKSQLRAEPDKIVLGVQHNVHMDHVAKLVRLYRAASPQVLLEFVMGNGDEVMGLLAEKKVDLVISKGDHQSEYFTPLINERLCVAVPLSHSLAQYSAADLAVLSGEPFIERINCSFWQQVNDVFLQENITPYTVMRAESDEFVLSMVAANLGVSIITSRQTPYEVRFIPIRNFNVQSHIGISVPSDEAQPHVCEFYQSIVARQFN